MSKRSAPWQPQRPQQRRKGQVSIAHQSEYRFKHSFHPTFVHSREGGYGMLSQPGSAQQMTEYPMSDRLSLSLLRRSNLQPPVLRHSSGMCISIVPRFQWGSYISPLRQCDQISRLQFGRQHSIKMESNRLCNVSSGSTWTAIRTYPSAAHRCLSPNVIQLWNNRPA